MNSKEYEKDLRQRMKGWSNPRYVNKLEPITVKLPLDLLQWLQDLVDRNIFPTRSEAIRFYLRAGKDFYPY